MCVFDVVKIKSIVGTNVNSYPWDFVNNWTIQKISRLAGTGGSGEAGQALLALHRPLSNATDAYYSAIAHFSLQHSQNM
jgi:hypothetical protein